MANVRLKFKSGRLSENSAAESQDVCGNGVYTNIVALPLSCQLRPGSTANSESAK
jgi:hypothetical protein